MATFVFATVAAIIKAKSCCQTYKNDIRDYSPPLYLANVSPNT